MPKVMGMSCSPDWVALAPLAICKKTGMKVSAPNINAPEMKEIMEQMVKTFILNRAIGRIGSLALRSMAIKPSVAVRNTAISPNPIGLVRANSLPPRAVRSTMEDRDRVSAAAPA